MKMIDRDSVTHSQLSALLGTLATMNGVLAALDASEQEGGKTDGGVRMAVENTMVGVCDRIDSLVADTQRWTMEKRNELEATMIETHKSIQRANEMLIAPHARFKPKLAQLSDGSWIVFLGEITDLDHALLGAGESPRAAIKAFDMLFNGEIPPELMHWIKQRDSNEKPNLDTNATGTVSGDETTGEDGAGNGDLPRQDDKGGASPTGTDSD